MEDKFTKDIEILVSDEEMIEALETAQKYCQQHHGCKKCINLRNCTLEPYLWRFENAKLQLTAMKKEGSE